MSTAIVPVERAVTREDFGARQIQKQAETSMAAVQAREEAMIKAEFVMAERHPRIWDQVRGSMLDHCNRPRFAEVSRYAKPVGKKLINGEWVEQFAQGFTARFAETLAQEMGNLKPTSSVTFEDDLIRIIRIGVVDLQKNLIRQREVTFAKTVEKRGRKVRGKKGEADTFEPPEGRELISSRLNFYGDPTYLVKATDDEMRNKVNSEESKTQRDFILKFCPRDLLEECEDRIAEALDREDKSDPEQGRKRMLDAFRNAGITAEDLVNFTGRTSEKWTASDVKELRQLGSAIKEGEVTFQQALKAKYAPPADEDGEETPEQRQERIRRQMAEQLATAEAMEANTAKRELARLQALKEAAHEPLPPRQPTLRTAAKDTKRENLLSQLNALRGFDALSERRFAESLAEHFSYEVEDLKTLPMDQLAAVLAKLQGESK